MRVYQLAEMNTNQIRAIDRARTAILIPGGVEEHGPYLPSYSDGYQNERLTAALAAAIAARPGWTAVVFPAIPLGSGGANAVGGKLPFPGTFRLLDGKADERAIPRIAALMQNPDVAKALERSRQRDAALAKRQQDWIAARR